MSKKPKNKVRIDKRALAVKHAITKHRYPHNLTCVKVSRKEVVASDGRMIVRIKNIVEQDENADGDGFLLPKATLAFIERMFGRGAWKKPVELEETEDGKLKVTGICADGEVKLEVPKEGSKFPDYNKVVPTDTTGVFTLSVTLLERMLKAAKAAEVQALRFRHNPERPNGPVLLEGTGRFDSSIFSAVMMPMREDLLEKQS